MSGRVHALGDSDGVREHAGGTLVGQRDSFEPEDLGRLPRSTRGPVLVYGKCPDPSHPLDNRDLALTTRPCKYPDELRERAVREVRTTGRPIAHVAKDLGIHKEALRGWVRQAEADSGERDDRLTSAEREELRQLRRENAELRRANEILKAASALFAQELDRPRTRPTR
jgi:transposase